jgi:solute carrier family 25 phosphate transporter 23/24/25/41
MAQAEAHNARVRAAFEAHARDAGAGAGKALGVAELSRALAFMGAHVKNGEVMPTASCCASPRCRLPAFPPREAAFGEHALTPVDGVQAGVQELLRKVDADESGSLSLAEFERLFSAARLRTVFEQIDADGSGSISQDEMVAALGLLGVRATKREAKRMVQLVDRNNDSLISWEEFHAAFQLVPLASLQAVANKWASMGAVDVGSDLAPLLPNPDLHLWQTATAGGCAGMASRTFTAPLERVKLAAQTRSLDGSMASALKRIYQQEGMRGLFRGNLANCIRVLPTGAITLTTYLNLLKLTPADAKIDAMEPVYRILCAGTAAAVGNVLTYPLDLVRARITLTAKGGPAYDGILPAFRHIHREAGVKGFYKGLRPTLLAVVPFVAVQQTTVDLTKALASDLGSPPTPPVLMACGASAGLLAQTVVYPLDILRRRMQLGATPSNLSS